MSVQFRLALVITMVGAIGSDKPAPPPPPPLTQGKLRVTGINVRKSLTAEKTVSAPMLVFGPKDTVFASIATEGISTSGATLAGRWAGIGWKCSSIPCRQDPGNMR